MPELLLNLRSTTYDEGDILVAVNLRRCLCVHAEHICLPKMPGGRLADMDGNGIMPPGHVSQDLHEETHQYRLERLSKHEGQITQLADGTTVRFASNVPFTHLDGSAAVMDLDMFCRGKRLADQFPVYGTYGLEVIYGGRIDFSLAKVNRVWDRIEAKTPHRRTDPERQWFPLGDLDALSFLPIPVEEFDDVEANSLVSPRYHPTTGEMQRKRGRRVANWRGLLARLGFTEAQALDRNFNKDRRASIIPWAHGPLVQNKP